jgi:recombination protein RecR
MARHARVAEPALDGLIEALRRLPGVGVKSAQRMAFHLLQHDRDGALRLAWRSTRRRARTHHCRAATPSPKPRSVRPAGPAARCARLLCVVETPADQAALERSGSYRGLYFVLMGRLSPLDGVGVDTSVRLELLERAGDGASRK